MNEEKNIFRGYIDNEEGKEIFIAINLNNNFMSVTENAMDTQKSEQTDYEIEKKMKV